MKTFIGLILVLFLAACSMSPAQVYHSSRDSFVVIQQQTREGRVIGGGSGVFIDNNGVIATAAHVVSELGEEKGLDKFKFVAVLSDGSSHEVYVIHYNKTSDLALVRLKDGREPPGCSRINPGYPSTGEPIVVIGWPLGMGETVMVGVVGSIRPSEPWKQFHPKFEGKWVQVSGFVVHGYSGGPVLDGNGMIVGILSHALMPRIGGYSGVGFAVPSPFIHDTYKAIYGKPPTCF